MASPFVTMFRVEGLRLLSTTFYPDAESRVVDRWFTCSFNRILASGPVGPSVSIAPPVPGGLSISAVGPNMNIGAMASFAPSTSYVITIDTSLHSSDGNHLLSPVMFAFRTSAFERTSSYPEPGATGVSTIWDLSINFTGRLDPHSVEGAFTISPPVDGLAYAPSQQPSQLRFALTDTLRSHTLYTVRVDTTLRLRSGDHLLTPIEFSFTTGGS
jgi:hypothetical protein